MEYLELDVNFSLDFKPGREGSAVEAMLEDSRRSLFGSLYTLSLPDFFLHLCAHLFKEATVMSWVEMGRDLSLYKFCDLYLLIDRFLEESLGREIQRRVESLRLRRECYYALLHTRRLFGIENRELDRLIAGHSARRSPVSETDYRSRRRHAVRLRHGVHRMDILFEKEGASA